MPSAVRDAKRRNAERCTARARDTCTTHAHNSCTHGTLCPPCPLHWRVCTVVPSLSRGPLLFCLVRWHGPDAFLCCPAVPASSCVVDPQLFWFCFGTLVPSWDVTESTRYLDGRLVPSLHGLGPEAGRGGSWREGRSLACVEAASCEVVGSDGCFGGGEQDWVAPLEYSLRGDRCVFPALSEG